ncbi:hypothetical protein NG791_24895 [Laspinema sp. D1]|uniref:hypothetical protein n=1 Tax=Laspinema palackyanum TaxID=3231601 RepID=UPI0034922F27|nr:hypothetical protein [Laspinema sp. D2b]
MSPCPDDAIAAKLVLLNRRSLNYETGKRSYAAGNRLNDRGHFLGKIGLLCFELGASYLGDSVRISVWYWLT